jgi:MFS family permease
MSARYLNRTILLLSAISFFADLSSEMLYPIFPDFLKTVGMGALGIGLLDGLGSLVAGIGKVYFGAWSDGIDRRMPFVRWGYGLSALSRPIMGLLPYAGVVTAARALDRMGKGMRGAARDALLVGHSRPEDRGKVFGFHRSMDTLGAVLGPLIALAYFSCYPEDYQGLFLLAFLPGIVPVVISFFIKEAGPAAGAPKTARPFAGTLQFWKGASADYKRLLLGFVLFSLLNSSDMLLLLRAGEIGMGAQDLILAYLLYNLVYALASWPLGGLGDRIGFKTVFVGSLLVFGGTYLAMGQVDSPIWVWFIFAAYGCFTAAHEGIAKSWLSLHIPSHAKATGQGLFHLLNTCALFVASAGAGLGWKLSSGVTTFTVVGIAALAVAALLTVLLPATPPRTVA